MERYSSILDLINKIKHSKESTDVVYLKQLLNEASDELEVLVGYCERLELWKQQGEFLIVGQKRISVMFAIAEWWSRRPWK